MAYFFQFWRSSPHSVGGGGQAPAAPPAASGAALPAASAAAQICTLQSQNAKQREVRQSLRRDKDDQDRLRTSKSTQRPVAGAQAGERAGCPARRPIPFDDSRRRRPPRAAPATRAHGVRDRVNDDMENKRPPIEGVARTRIKGFTTAAPASLRAIHLRHFSSWLGEDATEPTHVCVAPGLGCLWAICASRGNIPRSMAVTMGPIFPTPSFVRRPPRLVQPAARRLPTALDGLCEMKTGKARAKEPW